MIIHKSKHERGEFAFEIQKNKKSSLDNVLYYYYKTYYNLLLL